MRNRARSPYTFGLGLVLLLFTALGSYLLVARPLLDLSDSLDFIVRARRLFGPEGIWVDGIYPFGYPLLLHAAATAVTDYALAAKLLSLAAGVVALVFFYRASLRVFQTEGLPVLLTCFLAFDTAFFKTAMLDGTDMPALAALSIFLFYLTELPGPRVRPLFLAGLALGIGYLIRYSVLAALPPALLAIGLLSRHHRAERLNQAAALVGGYLLGAAPQLLLSLYVKGNPFFNEQFRNIWFGMYGKGDWGSHWKEAAAVNSLWQVVSQDPRLFLDNVSTNMSKVFFMHMFDYPFLFLSWTGVVLVLALKDWRMRMAAPILCMIGLGAAVSMAFVYWRLGIPALPGLILLSGLPFAWLGRLWMQQERISETVRKVVVAAVVSVCLGVTAERFWKNLGERIATPMTAADEARFGAREALEQHGYSDPLEVLSFSFDQYDTKDPTHPLYNRAWYYGGGQYPDTGSLARLVRGVRPRFLLTDNETHQVVPGFASFWPAAGFDRYADRIYSRAGVEVWKMRTAMPGAPKP